MMVEQVLLKRQEAVSTRSGVKRQVYVVRDTARVKADHCGSVNIMEARLVERIRSGIAENKKVNTGIHLLVDIC